MIHGEKNILWYSFAATLFAGLFILFFVLGYVAPCQADPSDCSGRDMTMVLFAAPMSYLVGLVSVLFPATWTASIEVQMNLVLFAGILQYGLLGVVGVWCVQKVKSVLYKRP